MDLSALFSIDSVQLPHALLYPPASTIKASSGVTENDVVAPVIHNFWSTLCSADSSLSIVSLPCVDHTYRTYMDDVFGSVGAQILQHEINVPVINAPEQIQA